MREVTPQRPPRWMPSLSLRWTFIGVGAIGGTILLFLMVAGDRVAPSTFAGLVTVSAALTAAVLASVADRRIVAELGLAGILSVLVIVLADRLLFDFSEVVQRQQPFQWTVLLALPTFAFAHFGARVGARFSNSRSLIQGLALGLFLVGASAFYLLLVSVAFDRGLDTLGGSILLTGLLLPTCCSLLFQSAYSRRLLGQAFATAPLFPFALVGLLILVRAPEGAEAIGVGFVIMLFIAGGCFLGGVIGRYFLRPPTPEVIPLARAAR